MFSTEFRSGAMTIRSRRLTVAEEAIADLRSRLRTTRWPAATVDEGWTLGFDIDYLREIVAYWADEFDFAGFQERLNARPNYVVNVDGLELHVEIHAPQRPSADSKTLLLLHGWPDGVQRFERLTPLLDEHTLVIPSYPGYGFSQKPTSPLSCGDFGVLMARLMDILGYRHYFVHGGDVGAPVADAVTRAAPDAVLGLHLTDLVYLLKVDPMPLPPAALEYLARGEEWEWSDGPYRHVQHSRPQMLAPGLSDSPAGLAAWILEKFRAWSDCGGDLESRFDRDTLLTNLSIYWFTESIGSSFWVYWATDDGQPSGRIDTPTWFSLFPEDLVRPTKVFADYFFNVAHWKEMPRGGHFAAMEEPELLADELRSMLSSAAPLQPHADIEHRQL
ncbi:epoxide hydrolase family protein [Microbacterium sp. X-17]|uniref:epoxide hydrolase family protein n=1 Tax=Microbacterium sp. X-17 TaxID=3144404 RepID=UPI0031F48C1C